MPLGPGLRLGPYEILSAIGAGGMGEVYKARDTRLDRDVAIKILPEAFAADADRVARFQREAKTLAALNHPNIAQIFGLEQAGDVHALAMELVAGEDLSERIARGAIPIDEALPIAKQIAEALEAAHEQGIVHRDLKPANIKVTADGRVKVLDFGLAKAMDPPASSPNVSQSPTITSPAMTQAGMILGTAAYMSPEQARGKVVDKRCDIWAFGCVLYEMVTGTRAFAGDDITDTIVAIVSKEPDWHALPPAAFGVRPLLARCLRKDPKARLRDIGEARIQIEELLKGAPTEASGSTASALTPSDPGMPRRRVAAIALATLVAGASVAVIATRVVARWAALPSTVQTARFAIVLPGAQRLTSGGSYRDLVLSPDGTRFVYVVNGQLMVRSIDQLDAKPLGGITGARFPFVSPDGRWVGFSDGLDLKKIPMAGGAPSLVCRFQGDMRGASWGSDNTIVFAAGLVGSRGLQSVPAAGGDPRALTKPDTARGELEYVLPSVLPGGQAVLFTMLTTDPSGDAVAVLDLHTGQHKTLIRGGTAAEYVDPGYLIYVTGGALRAVRFDVSRLEVVDDPVPVVEQVMTVGRGAANFSVSRNGVLVYVPGEASGRPARSLVWVDRQGHEEPISAPIHTYVYPRLSPDGTRVALNIQQGDQAYDISIWNFARQNLTPMTFGGGNQYAVWTPDGKRVIFSHNGTVAWQSADNTGAIESLTTGQTAPHFPYSISPDGKSLVFQETFPKTGRDLSVLSLESFSTSLSAPNPQTKPLIQTTSIELNGEISPNGHLLAYQSNEQGQDEIYVRPFPNVENGKWLVSTAGGTRPLWAPNGRELFYIDVGGYLTTVPVETASAFSYGNPTRVLSTKFFSGLGGLSQAGRTYDVSRDGQRFLMIKENARGEQGPATIVVVLNWLDELKQREPTK